MDLPLVSCVCVTENRVHYLKRAIACFEGQDYPHKELVIVYRDGDKSTAELLRGLKSPPITSHVIPSAKQISLGDLRNISIEASHGYFFCQWDDDDWYHRERISQQVTAATNNGKDASVLNHLIFFDAVSGKAYFSFDRPWENTILCKKEVFMSGFRYQDLNQTEDTLFMSSLLFANKLSAVTAQPSYIYIYHGGNTFKQSHFESLFSFSQPLSDQTNKLIHDIVTRKIDHAEASAQLRSNHVKSEFDYFYRWRKHLRLP